MNERIEEFADQAWVYQMTVYEYDGVRTYGEREQVFSKEKFAELLIKECIDTVLDSSVEYATRSQIAQELKEHFEIK